MAHHRLHNAQQLRLFLLSIVVLLALVSCKDGGCGGCKGSASQSHAVSLSQKEVDMVKGLASRIPSDVLYTIFAKSFDDESVQSFFDTNNSTKDLKEVMGVDLDFEKMTGINCRNNNFLKESGIDIKGGFAFAQDNLVSPRSVALFKAPDRSQVTYFVFRVDDVAKVKTALVPKWKGDATSETKKLLDQEVETVKVSKDMAKAWFFQGDYATLILTNKHDIDKVVEKSLAMLKGVSFTPEVKPNKKGKSRKEQDTKDQAVEEKKDVEETPAKVKIESIAAAKGAKPFEHFVTNVWGAYPLSLFKIPDEEMSRRALDFLQPKDTKLEVSYAALGIDLANENKQFYGYVRLGESSFAVDLGKLFLTKGTLDFEAFATTDLILAVRMSLDPQELWKLYLAAHKGREQQVKEEMNKDLGDDFEKVYLPELTGEAAFFYYGSDKGPLAMWGSLESKENMSKYGLGALLVPFKTEEGLKKIVQGIAHALAKDVKVTFTPVKIDGNETAVQRIVFENAEKIDFANVFAYGKNLLISSVAMEEKEAVARLTGKIEKSSLLSKSEFVYAKKFFAENSSVTGFYINLPELKTAVSPILSLFGQARLMKELGDYLELSSTLGAGVDNVNAEVNVFKPAPK